MLGLATRTSCTACCGWPVIHKTASHQGEAFLLRCKTAVRRTSCGFQSRANAAYHAAQARRLSLSLRRRRIAPAS